MIYPEVRRKKMLWFGHELVRFLCHSFNAHIIYRVTLIYYIEKTVKNALAFTRTEIALVCRGYYNLPMWSQDFSLTQYLLGEVFK